MSSLKFNFKHGDLTQGEIPNIIIHLGVLLTVGAGTSSLIEARLSPFQALSPTSSEAETVSLVGVHIHINIVSVYTQNKYIHTEVAT